MCAACSFDLSPFILRRLRHSVAVICCILAWGVGIPSVQSAHMEDRIVAIVNSDLIMWSDIKREFAPDRERIMKQYGDAEREERLKTAEYMALTNMIERKIQLQEAKVRGIDVSEQEVLQTVQQMKQQGEKIDETDPYMTKSVREQLTLLRVVDREVRSGVMVSDSDMKRYFQEHRDRFALPEEYTLSQILIQSPSPAQMADAKAKVRKIVALLKQGNHSKIWRCAIRTASTPREVDV